MSVFKPVNQNLYEVIESLVMNENVVIKSSPIDNVCLKTPKPIKVETLSGKRGKKYWSLQQKQIAIAKAKILGLSKATRCLQTELPNVFGDLSPSTLQYWIQKDKEQPLF